MFYKVSNFFNKIKKIINENAIILNKFQIAKVLIKIFKYQNNQTFKITV